MALSRCVVDLELRPVAGMGKGVFACQEIAAGEMVVILGGHVMTLKEEQSLPESMRDLSLQITEDHVIGPMSENELSVADFVNHSCEPNCGFSGQIILISMRNINKGEQITFDYSMCIYTPPDSLDDLYQFECNCKSTNCRKKVTSLDYLNDELQNKYSGFFSYFVKKKIDFL